MNPTVLATAGLMLVVLLAYLIHKTRARRLFNERGFITIDPKQSEKIEAYTDAASAVLAAEQSHLAGKENGNAGQFSGLAISGGGIRSASFGLGVMQALVANGVMERLDYLSTVSGGGYIGSALTWCLHKGLPDNQTVGTSAENFPLGQIDAAARIEAKGGNKVLDFIRQHGNYLTPGKGLDKLSLLGITVRSMLVSISVYLGIFTVLMWLLQQTPAFTTYSLIDVTGWTWLGATKLTALIWISAATFAVLAVMSLAFSVRTGISFKLLSDTTRYKRLIGSQRRFGLGWRIILVTLVLGLIPFAATWFGDWWQKLSAAGVSTIAGSISGYLQHKKSEDPKAKGGAMSTLRIVLGALAVMYGLLVGAYVLAGQLTSVTQFAILFVATAFFGLLVNLNYSGLHRMYRDRLMEALMPNAENVNSNTWGAATDADGALVEDMCKGKNNRPYHLVNTNIVLVDSHTSKFRGRGGDSFVISPLYCGSDATGWCASKAYMKQTGSRGMTFPTAVAISGAALNPDAGVGGKGATRNKFVSMLMGMLNLRLGYWAPNPNPKKHMLFQPNYIFPGFFGDIMGAGLSETRSAIELSDGGHFENLALYELIRRQLRLIIVSDAGADPDFQFGDLANAVERVRVDFGAKIRFRSGKTTKLEDLLPGSADKSPLQEKYNLAKRGFAVADITYHDGSEGTLIYIKTTLTPDLPADLYGYKSAHQDYPDQSTADQFFDEDQFEAYRELGYQLTWQMLEEPSLQKLWDSKVRVASN